MVVSKTDNKITCIVAYYFLFVNSCVCSRPDLIEYDQLLASPSSYMGNLNNAFKVAEQELGLPQLLDPEGNHCTVAYYTVVVYLYTFMKSCCWTYNLYIHTCLHIIFAMWIRTCV